MTLPHLLQLVPRAPRPLASLRHISIPLALAALVLSNALPRTLAAQEADNGGNTAPLAASATVADVLPSQALGADDLLQIMVPYCPELSRSFRVSSDGTLALPLLKQRIAVAGLQPSQVEKKIAAELLSEQVLADPVVNISVLEYRSKPVSVVGAVNHPLTFQATGGTTLLDAIAKAGGLTTAVGPTITVTHREQIQDGTMHITVQSIPVKGLIESADPKLNVKLTGDEEVRVPEAGRIFVAGNVKKPGSFTMQDNSDTTVVKALAMSEGLQAYSTKLAYIYRERSPGTQREEISVPLSRIMARKAPDVVLQPDDILYVPENSKGKMTAKVLAELAGFGTSTAAGMLIYH
jgi:polysaccharide export outer membrane protein